MTESLLDQELFTALCEHGKSFTAFCEGFIDDIPSDAEGAREYEEAITS